MVAALEAGAPWQVTFTPFSLNHRCTSRTKGSRVFGVPTFVVDGKAVFVRLLTRHDGDAAESQRTIESVIELITGRPELNEFKHTSIPR